MMVSLIRNLVRDGLRNDVHVLLLSALAWLALSVCEPTGHPEWKVVCFFSLGSALLSFFSLKLIGYCNPLRLLPRKSDVFLAICAYPLAGVAQYMVTIVALESVAINLWHMIVLTPLLAAAVFGAHYAINWRLIQKGRRLRIVLDLLPAERAHLVEEFAAFGEARHSLEFLSKSELREYFLQARENEIDLIVISRGASNEFERDGTIIRAHLAGIPIADYAKIITTLSGRIRLSEIDAWSYVLGAVPQTAFIRAFANFKIIVEPLIACVLGLVFSPVILGLALIIKATSRGPVFYRQVRTGYLGKNFTLVKFRSMYTDAERDGIQWSSKNDHRVTPIGKFMRKTRLDELPQLWNVIRGEMGFFGPRPERPEIYRELKKEIPLFSLRTVVRPGITGWAQVCAGYAASVAESRTKLEYDLFYIQNNSPRLDLIILFKTIEVALFGDKAVKRGVLEDAPTIAVKSS
jgi:lipopolysaccharide/colanic/teichoic acid biosynthesis glycosyltransferase